MTTQWLHRPVNPPIPSEQTILERAAGDPDKICTIASLIAIRKWLCAQHPLDGEGDFEDFVERTLRTYDALDAVGPENLWLDEDDGSASRVSDGTVRHDLAGMPYIGMVASPSACAPSHSRSELSLIGNQLVMIQQNTRFGDYASSPTFIAHNRRGVQLAGGTSQALVDAVRAALVHAVDRTVWLKGRRMKSFNVSRVIPAGWEHSDEPAQDLIEDLALGYDGLSMADLILAEQLGADSTIISPHVRMEHEYRFFVIGSQLVSGAGCIEEHTPLDDLGHVFDHRVEGVRGDGDIRPEPMLVQRMADRVTEILPALSAEGLHSGVIDMAIIDGEPVIVEFNPLTNAGFYAADSNHIYHTWAQHPELTDHTVVLSNLAGDH